MDVFDRATEAEEQAFRIALANQKIQAEAETKALNVLKGECLYCREKLDKEHRFCDVGCQEDFEAMSRAHEMRAR